jgi:hypothetical protein
MAWELTGNTGTTASNFLGTTDQRPFVIKTNNKEVVRVNPDGPANKVEIAAPLAVTGDRPFITLQDANAGNAPTFVQNMNGDILLIPANPGGAIAAMVLKANTDIVGIGILNPPSDTKVAIEAEEGHGLFSRSETGNGVIGHSNGDPAGGNAGLFGEHLNNGTGVTGKSEGGNGVAGLSQTGKGVFGLSVSEHGVFGQSQNSRGVGGISDTDIGVFGVSTSGQGVRGQSVSEHGVLGTSQSSRGVGGISETDIGVFGVSTSGQGVRGQSVGGIGVFGTGRVAGRFEGDVEVTGDIRLVHADCAEDFDIAGMEKIESGTVMVLNQDGTLQPSQQPYDKKVAGVISGTGDYKPAIVLDRQPTDTNRLAIALIGKVYCKVDARYLPIEVGDLLTTSPTRGHAMKAEDSLKAFGAVIGKALRPLASGHGLIPILIALQ